MSGRSCRNQENPETEARRRIQDLQGGGAAGAEDTHGCEDGEGAPQRHPPGVAVGADKALLVEEAVALAGLEYPGTPEREVEPLSSPRWKRREEGVSPEDP